MSFATLNVGSSQPVSGHGANAMMMATSSEPVSDSYMRQNASATMRYPHKYYTYRTIDFDSEIRAGRDVRIGRRGSDLDALSETGSDEGRKNEE